MTSLSLFQPVQRRIERTFLHAQQAIGGALDVQRDPEAVIGPTRQRFEDQQYQRTLQLYHMPLG